MLSCFPQLIFFNNGFSKKNTIKHIYYLKNSSELALTLSQKLYF